MFSRRKRRCERTPLTRLRERNRVPADATKRIEHRPAPTPLRNARGDAFGRDAVPALIVQQTPLVVEREVPVALEEI